MTGTTDFRFYLRNYFLKVIDSLLVLAIVVGYLRFFHHKGFDGLQTFVDKPEWFVLILVLWFIVAWAFDLYDPAISRRRGTMIRKTIAVAFVTAVVYLFTPFLSPNFPLTRMPAAVFIGSMVVGPLLWRLAYSGIFRSPILPRRVLLVGDGWQVEKLLDTLLADERVYQQSAYKVLGRLSLRGGADYAGQNGTSGNAGGQAAGLKEEGIGAVSKDIAADASDEAADESFGLPSALPYSDRPLSVGASGALAQGRKLSVKPNAHGVPVLDHPERLESYIRRLDVEEIILAGVSGRQLDAQNFALLSKAREWGIRISSAAEVFELVTGKMMVQEDNGLYLLVNAFAERETDRLYRLINRALNIFWGAAGTLAFLLVVPFVWLTNLVFSRGPLFYSQERVGRRSKIFRIYKFRTMVVDAEKAGPQMASQNDSRITGVGQLLRKSRIDELPQFWNLLKGDMNLIGPRPERPEFVDELSARINFYPARHAIKPGITGWAQVNYKYGSDYLDSLVKLQYDLYYIKHRSFLLDLGIVSRTFGVILKFKGT